MEIRQMEMWSTLFHEEKYFICLLKNGFDISDGESGTGGKSFQKEGMVCRMVKRQEKGKS